MWIFQSIIGEIFKILFFPFRNLSPWVGMIFISLLTAFFMLFVFRFTSNQKGIRKIKNRIKAHLLELRLFKDSFAVSRKAQGNILRCNLKYMGYSARPMLVMIIPLILIIIHLNLWFGYISLSRGEQAILKIKLKEGIDPLKIDLSVVSSSGFTIEIAPLRIIEESEIDYRFRTLKKGVREMALVIDGREIHKRLAVGERSLSRISPTKVRKDFLALLLNPGEPPLPSDCPIEAIKINYPSKNMNLFGWHIHWIIVYFVLSIIFGFAFKGVFKVEI
jgi:hypothetical protein